MNGTNDFERDLTRWMAAAVPAQAPGELAPSVVDRTRMMRPRPAWLARLLEPPMQTQLSLRRYLGFGRSPRLILAVLLIITLVAGGFVVGSQLLRQRALPPPFGLADNGLIAVSMTTGAIVLMEPDGSKMRPLELPFRGLSGTSFSRDGTRLAAWARPSNGRTLEKTLIVANVDGSGAFEFDATDVGTEPGFRIAWSPDDRHLAYSDTGGRSFVADIDARTVLEIGRDESVLRRTDPAWAPDGRLAFRCTTADRVLHLCVMSADYQAEQVLPTSPGTEWAFQAPSWSHDGRSIAYQVDDTVDLATGFGWDVATIDVATGTERILTRGFADHTILPVWSPDDLHVLFGTAGGPAVVRSDGTDLRVLGDGGCNWAEPSPDGASIACVRSDQVVLYPIAGGQPTVIQLGGEAEFVSWQRLGR